MKKEKTLRSKQIYDGKIINLRIDTVELNHKEYAEREIVEHPGAVGILAITPNQEVILVRQFRKPVEEALLEIPAGKLEVNEDPKLCAIRELKEETGYTANNLNKLMTFYTTPGFSNEIMHIYLAEGLEAGEATPDEGEYIEFVYMSLQEAMNGIATGLIKDSKTIVAILAYKANLIHK